MKHSDVDRRAFIAGLLSLGARQAAAAPSCAVPSAPLPTLSPEVGVAYSERFSGVLGGALLELELELEVASLTAFLAGPQLARVTRGSLRWGSALPKTELTEGTEQLFTPCQDGKKLSLSLTFLQPNGQRGSLSGTRTLDSLSQRDPAAELSELHVVLEAEGTQLATGQLTRSIEDTLRQLLSVRALRAEGAARTEARDAFLELYNRACADVHPDLPTLVSNGGPLTPTERRALLLAATVMLPVNLPASGPTNQQAIDQLSTFIGNADQAAFSSLRTELQLLGKTTPFLRGFVPEIRKFALGILESDRSNLLRPLLDSLHKVAVLGYYSHARADALLGYRRPTFAPLNRTALPVRTKPTTREFDVVIVGAGVAGSLLAERLTARGKSVLLLEAGPYIRETELTTDEPLWTARLQKMSGLQRANTDEPLASRVGSVVMLQAACVGGGGMINNAVCFMLPERRLEQWRGLGFPVDPADLRQSYLTVAEEVQIGPASDKTAFLNPVCLLLEQAFGKAKKPQVGVPLAPDYYECLVNLAPHRCLGCGMCNTGCGSERKRNALQVHLPRALAPDRDAELVPEAAVSEILVGRSATGQSYEVKGLAVRTRDGNVTVRARQYVLSAGAINTSVLMLKSPQLMRAVGSLPIGRRFSANIVSPMLSFYDQPLGDRPTLQLTHYYAPPGKDDGFLIENLNNPPGQSALVVPGYGELHHQRMLKFRSTALTGIAIGTLPNGKVGLRHDGSTNITLPLGENEHQRMRAAFGLLARALFQGGAGFAPREVIGGALGGGFVMKSAADVPRFDDWFKSTNRVLLSTGHPQGGSAMSDDTRISVVDESFRVRGISNLRVCDASLFPMVTGVNPQWTVMALADHCARVMNREA